MATTPDFVPGGELMADDLTMHGLFTLVVAHALISQGGVPRDNKVLAQTCVRIADALMTGISDA